MKKMLIAVLVLSMLLPCLAGCVDPNRISTEGTHPVTDHNGNTVEVPYKIEKIVVADIFPLPSILAVFFDSAERIVGIPKSSMAAAKNGLLGQLYPEILQASTAFSDGNAFNAEELIKLEPDVVFYSSTNEESGAAFAQEIVDYCISKGYNSPTIPSK